MKAQRKIVMLGTRADACGGIASVVNVYASEGMFERGDIVYLATHCSGSSSEKIMLFVTAMARLLYMIMGRQVALVHLHVAINASFWRKYSFLLVLIALRVPKVMHVHAGRFPEFYEQQCGPGARFLIRYAFRHADRIIAVSAELHEWIVGLTGKRNVTTITNPAVGCTLPLPYVRVLPILLFLGHVEHSKGAFDLIRAMPAIRARCPDATLRVCGDGDLEQARALVRSLALDDCVEILGWVDQRRRAQLLRQASVFVLPSYFEGLPMSLLEAMANALPVVASGVGGIPEAVTDGVEGLLVAPGDVGAISSAVQRLLQDPGEGVRMGLAGQARAARQFSSASMVAALDALYEQVVAEQGGADRRHMAPAVTAGTHGKLGAEVRNEDLV